MSVPPTPPQEPTTAETGRSSVKLTRNAKGQIQFEVKVYEPEGPADPDWAYEKAVEITRNLEREFPWQGG